MMDRKFKNVLRKMVKNKKNIFLFDDTTKSFTCCHLTMAEGFDYLFAEHSAIYVFFSSVVVLGKT